MKKTKAQGTAHGKVILIGEHAVVYGEPAIAVPFPAVQVTAAVNETEGPVAIDCSYYQGIAAEMPEILESLRTATEAAFAAVEAPYENVRIEIKSTIPPERGMGSSAAVSVAVIRAVFHYFDVPLSRETLLELAGVAEKVAHGNPSGLDAATTSSQEPLYYQKGHPFSGIQVNLPGYLIVADTGVTGQTRAAVETIAALLKTAQAARTEERILRIGSLVREARRHIEEGDLKQLGTVLDQSHAELQALQVSSPELDRLVETAKKAGALGAKLTGGGRGGCMIALAATFAQAQQIEQHILQAGAVKTWIAALSLEEAG